MRTAYSASVSDCTRVILMSPYISESSGQYLEHFTCKEGTGWAFRLLWSRLQSHKVGRSEGEAYPAHFHQLGYHHNAGTVLLPHHAPEVVHHLLLGTCGMARGGSCVGWVLGDPQLASTAQPGVENVDLGIFWLGQLTGFAIAPFGPKTGPFPPFSHKHKVKYPRDKTRLLNPAEREERGRLTLGGYEVVGPVVTLQGKQRRQVQGGPWGTQALPHQTLLSPPAGPQAGRATSPMLPQHPILAQISSPPSQQRLL